MQIKETMQRYGYTPTTLAKKMGVFDSTVSRLMNGNPTVQKLDELAKEIGCRRWEFFIDEIEAAGYRLTPVGSQAGDGGGTPVQQPSADDALPFGGGQEAREDDVRRADAVSVARFECDCPHCGKGLKVSIEQS